VVQRALNSMQRAGSLKGGDMWEESKGLLGLGTQFLDRLGTETRATALEVIRYALVSRSPSALEETKVAGIFLGKLTKRKIIWKVNNKPSPPPKKRRTTPHRQMSGASKDGTMDREGPNPCKGGPDIV
jgi:hypothetical protein